MIVKTKFIGVINVSDYRKLKVWEKAHECVLETYRITEKYPKSELYALVSQMRRAAVSIPSNIAEGYGNGYNKNVVRFLNIALGSTFELEYQFFLSKDLGYLSEEKYNELAELIIEIKKMIIGLIKSLNIRLNVNK